jgi:blue copper oxidase
MEHHDEAAGSRSGVPGWSRRRFLQLASVAGVVTVGGGVTAVASGAAKGGGGSKGGTAAHLYPLHVPPTRLLGAGTATLHPGPATVDIGGMSASLLAYDGSFPGPTLVAQTGSTPTIDVTNGLDEPTTVHWHGLIVPTAVDGQPHEAFGPGATQRYELPLHQRAGLNFYHPHPHLRTANQVAAGLSGAFIVRDAEEAALGLPSGAYEVPLVLRDASFDSAGAITYNGTASGYLGNVSLVNGTRSPYHLVNKAVYRFRILNGANSRVYRLALSNGAPFTLIGNDGGLLRTPAMVNEIVMSSAERVDVLVDLRGASGSVFLRDLDSGWSLLELRIPPGAPTVSSAEVPGTLSTIETLSNEKRTRSFGFDGNSKINGVVYSMNQISFTVPKGDVERWVFTTKGSAPHPVHVHGASFQVVSRTGGRGRVLPWEHGWKDTVLLNNKERVEVLVRFDLEGRYLLHCHKLEHEDAGMMLNFQVGPSTGAATTMATSDTGTGASHDGH